MTNRRDASLAAYLRAKKLINQQDLGKAIAHQQTNMPKASLAQVLLTLRLMNQEDLTQANRAVDATIEKDNAQNAVQRPMDVLTRAVTDAKTTSEELKHVATAVAEELKRG